VGASVCAAVAAWVFVVFPPGRSWHADEPLQSWIEWLAVAAYAVAGWAVIDALWPRVPGNGAAIALCAALVPAALLIAGLVMQPMHRALDDAIAIWNGYELPIETGTLTPPRVANNVDNAYETVCAVEVRPNRGASDVCLEIDLSSPRGQEVQGGFRYDFGPAGELPSPPYDCFGEPVACR